ncbi:MAG: hypothetical protein KUG77_05445 [Nannocystaceae bacterium]|nr:hypothetical protein [Nannocystaceae bacterium]
MATRLSTAALTLCLTFGLAGCEKLRDSGIQEKCPPCVSVPLTTAWERPMLASLVPTGDAVVCEATGGQAGDAGLSYWLPHRVHESNVATVGTVQEAGWIRTGDNWYEDDDHSQMAKWSEFGLKTGDTLRMDIKAEAGGTRVELKLKAPPRSPVLQGDISIFAYRDASYALQDGRIVALPGVVGGATISSMDSFYFRTAAYQYGQYQPDGTAVVYPAFPTSDGSTTAHGRGPRGMPWVSHNPTDRSKPLLLGELINGMWDLEVVAGVSPRLPSGSVDAAVTDTGTVWLLVDNVLYAKVEGEWRGRKLNAKPAPLRPLVAEADSVLISTEHGVLRAHFNGKRVTTAPVVSLDFYPELFDAGAAGVVARTRTEVVLIDAETSTKLELPGDSLAPDIAINARGVIAVATKSPSTIIVRDTDGGITRYPDLSRRVASMSVDPLGRVWALLVDGDPVVADRGTLVPLLGLAEDGMRPSSVTFMGNGAPPILEAEAEHG